MILPQGFLSVAQVAERLGCSAMTVRRLVSQGLLEAVLPRGRTRGMLVSEAALERFLAEGFCSASCGRESG